MIRPNIKDYHSAWRSHFIEPIYSKPYFLQRDPMEMRWQKDTPDSNILKKGDQVYLEINLAGFEKNEIEIYVDDNMLTVRAEKNQIQNDDSIIVMQEYDLDIKERKFKLSENVDHEKLEATYSNGILKVFFTGTCDIELEKRKIEIG